MNILSLFKKAPAPQAAEAHGWLRSLGASGIHVHRDQRAGDVPLSFPTLTGLLTQLSDDGLIQDDEHGRYFLAWDSLYEAMALPAYAELTQALELPATTGLRPTLTSRHALTDSDFSISLGAWRDASGKALSPHHLGPVLQLGSKTELMSAPQWDLFKRVLAFAGRFPEDHTDHRQRQAWGQIRRSALAANGHMSDFLVKTVVLTPERLKMAFRKSDATGKDTLVEVIPGFEGAPPNWLEQFDRFDITLDHYDLPMEDGGLVQIVLSPQVKTVLQQIKRFPARRVAGSRAQAFLLNPFATLGEAASEVIDEAQFEQAREDAGLEFERFTPVIERDGTGFAHKVGILIESASSHGPTGSDTQYLDDAELSAFVASVEQAISRGLQLAFWQGSELEILGETPDHIHALKQALAQRTEPRLLVTHAQVHDLSHYSSRIEGIGVELPYYSPY